MVKFALSVSPDQISLFTKFKKENQYYPRLHIWLGLFFLSPSLSIQVGHHLLQVQLESWMQSSAIQVSVCFRIGKLD